MTICLFRAANNASRLESSNPSTTKKLFSSASASRKMMSANSEGMPDFVEESKTT
jgi:hypothetical protein